MDIWKLAFLAILGLLIGHIHDLLKEIQTAFIQYFLIIKLSWAKKLKPKVKKLAESWDWCKNVMGCLVQFSGSLAAVNHA